MTSIRIHPERPEIYQARGFSLVEIMVAMLIGMIGIIVMMQLFALSESQKRTTTGAGDAQSSGAIALFGLERDIRLSGYGISDAALLGCNLTLPAVAAVAPALGRVATTLNAIAPLTINHGSIPQGDANTDTLLIISGNGNGSPQGDTIASPTLTTFSVTTANTFAVGDRVIAAPTTRLTPCALDLQSVALPLSTTVITLGSASAANATMANGTLFNLGQAPSIRAYAVRSGNLTVCDHMANDCTAAGSVANAAVWVPIANNVVSLRAEYGMDSSAVMDGFVDSYSQTMPATAPVYCAWVKTTAVRLALVARSGQPEKTAVTATAPVWAGTTSATPVSIVLTGTPVPTGFTWQNFRYKVFKTTVPIRNVSWMSGDWVDSAGLATGTKYKRVTSGC